MTSLVFIYFNKKNYSNAEECLNKILFIDKSNLDARYNLGAIYATEGKRIKAKQIWSQIVNNFPSSSLITKSKRIHSKL